jgi:hypothetical protein
VGSFGPEVLAVHRVREPLVQQGRRRAAPGRKSGEVVVGELPLAQQSQ